VLVAKPDHVLALLALALGLSCGSLSLVRGHLDEAFVLQVGQEAELADDGLRVGFTAVREDSRCPPGVQCFWEGVATAALWAEKTGHPRSELLLATINTQGHSTQAEYLGYEIALADLAPPRTGDIAQGAYRLTLVIRSK
jgi:hypothetical protein